VIRAIGYPEFAPVAPSVIELLADKDAHVRNCAVVTLEEMANPAACEPLIQLHRKEKDPETKKDVVRALGPCGAGNAEARALLVKALGSSEENVRSAAALSLGWFLTGEAEIDKALRARWQKEGNNLRVKTAILWGIGQSADPGQARLVDDLVADERNGQIKDVATAVKARLTGGDPWTALGGGGGGGPKSGRGGGRGRLMRLLQPLYADDKVVRNRIKDFRNFTGG
jgi:HEAT repeat protein